MYRWLKCFVLFLMMGMTAWFSAVAQMDCGALSLLLFATDGFQISTEFDLSNGGGESRIWDIYGFSESATWVGLSTNEAAISVVPYDNPVLGIIYDEQLNVIEGNHAYDGESLYLCSAEIPAAYLELTTFTGARGTAKVHTLDAAVPLSFYSQYVEVNGAPTGWDGNTYGYETYFEVMPVDPSQPVVFVSYEPALSVRLVRDRMEVVYPLIAEPNGLVQLRPPEYVHCTEIIAQDAAGFGNGGRGLREMVHSNASYTLVIHSGIPTDFKMRVMNATIKKVDGIIPHDIYSAVISTSVDPINWICETPKWTFGNDLEVLMTSGKEGEPSIKAVVNGDRGAMSLGSITSPERLVVNVPTNCYDRCANSWGYSGALVAEYTNGTYYPVENQHAVTSYATSTSRKRSTTSTLPDCFTLNGSTSVTFAVPDQLALSERPVATSYERMPNDYYVHIFHGNMNVLSDCPVKMGTYGSRLYHMPTNECFSLYSVGFHDGGGVASPDISVLDLESGLPLQVSSMQWDSTKWMTANVVPAACGLVVHADEKVEYFLLHNAATLVPVRYFMVSSGQ